LAAQKAFTSAGNPVLGAFAAAAATAAGVAWVAKIISTQFISGGGGGYDGNRDNITPPSGPSAPSNPFVNQPANAPIRVTGIGGPNHQVQRVYVLESDISNTQNRVRVLENNSNARF
jgi:hypothetical protein